jgi:hypothetical protein
MEPVYGNYVGLVINSNDPENRNRVQVFIPHLTNTVYKNWNERMGDTKLKPEELDKNIISPLDLDSSVMEELIKTLPWAEAAVPVFGGSTGLTYNRYGGNPTSAGIANTAPSTDVTGQPQTVNPTVASSPNGIGVATVNGGSPLPPFKGGILSLNENPTSDVFTYEINKNNNNNNNNNILKQYQPTSDVNSRPAGSPMDVTDAVYGSQATRPLTSSKDGKGNVAPSFGNLTFSHPWQEANLHYEFKALISRLSQLMGRNFIITSGYRDPAYNNMVAHTGFGGPHTEGTAADISWDGWSIQDKIKMIQFSKQNGITGIGVYSGWIHIDKSKNSPRPAAWGDNGSRTSLVNYTWATPYLGDYASGNGVRNYTSPIDSQNGSQSALANASSSSGFAGSATTSSGSQTSSPNFNSVDANKVSTTASVPDPSIGGTGSPNGYFSTPSPGAKVWVFFYGGDIQKPVWFAAVPEPGGNASNS